MLESQDGQGMFSLVTDQPKLALGSDLPDAGERHAAEPAREFGRSLRGNGEKQFQVFTSVECVAEGSLRESRERGFRDARPYAACFAEARQVNREAVAQVHQSRSELALAEVAADAQTRLGITERLEGRMGPPQFFSRLQDCQAEGSRPEGSCHPNLISGARAAAKNSLVAGHIPQDHDIGQESARGGAGIPSGQNDLRRCGQA